VPSGNSPRVLSVEDDPSLRDALESALSSQGYVVASAANGSQLRDLTACFRPDIAVLDVNIAEGPSGLSIARMLREWDDLPILFLSAADAPADRLAGFAAGGDDYLTKPFVMDELFARVRALLKRSGRLTSASWQVGDLVIDESARSALRAGVPLELTRTEFDLLVALGRHPGHVLSKHQLLASVWGYEDYEDNVVEVRVSGLRRKLEEHGPRLIYTVRGSGYQMRPAKEPA
jgi:two-component system, OmpR family, response regulator